MPLNFVNPGWVIEQDYHKYILLDFGREMIIVLNERIIQGLQI